MMSKARLVLCAVVIGLSSIAYAEEENRIRFSYELSAATDDNVRRAQYPEDIREDNMLNLSFKAKRRLWGSRYSQFGIGARLELEQYATFDRLDNRLYEVQLKYNFAFGSEFTSAVYALKLDLGGIDSESEMRSSDTMGLSLELNRWLSSALNLTAGMKLRNQESQSRVFDTSEFLMFANLDLELSRRHLLYFTYHYISGDIVSSATPRLKIINAADAIEPDDAFGGVALNQFAYRLDADSQVMTLGYNAGLSGKLSLDLSLRIIDSVATADDSIYYDRMILRASLVGRF